MFTGYVSACICESVRLCREHYTHTRTHTHHLEFRNSCVCVSVCVRVCWFACACVCAIAWFVFRHIGISVHTFIMTHCILQQSYQLISYKLNSLMVHFIITQNWYIFNDLTEIIWQTVSGWLIRLILPNSGADVLIADRYSWSLSVIQMERTSRGSL